jgi:hypothetical protein
MQLFLFLIPLLFFIYFLVFLYSLSIFFFHLVVLCVCPIICFFFHFLCGIWVDKADTDTQCEFLH